MRTLRAADERPSGHYERSRSLAGSLYFDLPYRQLLSGSKPTRIIHRIVRAASRKVSRASGCLGTSKANGGTLTNADKAALNHRQNNASANIYNKKHNGRTR
jgi:hypothetical protein